MKDNKIEVFNIGSDVKLADDVFGKVTGIIIRGNNSISYDVSWWNGRSYDCKNFADYEIEITTSTTKQKIGFL
jgi:hypothetical protein